MWPAADSKLFKRKIYLRVANRRATAIAKTDGAKLTAELVGAAVEGSDAAWVTGEDIAEGAEVLVVAAAMAGVGEAIMDTVVDALV